MVNQVTVLQLIERLSKYPGETVVGLEVFGGYTLPDYVQLIPILPENVPGKAVDVIHTFRQSGKGTDGRALNG